MKQEQFEALHAEEWATFERWLKRLSLGSRERKKPLPGDDYPGLYRRICHHLALARARQYSGGLQQRLNHLALEGHQYLYRRRDNPLSRIARFLVHDFPAAVGAHPAFVLVSSLLFFATGFAVALAIAIKPEVIYSIVDPVQVAQMEAMYEPDNDVLGRERESDTDLMMFGYYIWNNVSIGFRTFASGLVFGIGTVFILVFNGLVIGGIAAHLTSAGYIETFWGFVAGHSSFELIGIVVFGAVGLAIGRRIIAPGRKARWQAVRDQARASLPMIYGGTLLLFIAAFVEAFWSSTTWPPYELKYAIGIGFWVLNLAYFTLLGRHEPR